jgi:phthiocerol/phenolphthiocerol synthesis type-I polyketide synthase E
MTTELDRFAIVGMAGRFPGAPSVDALWQMLVAGASGISVFTDEELAAAGVPPELLADPAYVKARACLDRIEFFDASFFGYLPAEAALLDPQQRLFLECAWEALEQAGYGDRRRRPRTGVIAGASASSYQLHLLERLGPAAREPFALDGTLADFVAQRAAYDLDLRGPALTAQTACSSSLVAVHLACQALLLGEADMMLAGAASIAVPARVGRLWQEGSITSRDGRCRPFDAEATGTVGGDAVIAIVLRRMADAIRDRDSIHAVVRASAINNDGADKAGFIAPSVNGQAAVVRDALALAEVAPNEIGYIEAHGSGTRIGDPIEVAALAAAFAGALPGSIPIGSIKSNIGHTDAAAGLAGLVKAALCLREQKRVPTLGFSRPNPFLDLPSTPFSVQTVTEPWPDGPPRLAGVSSFGMGGTNVHVVLEEPPRSEHRGRPGSAAMDASSRPLHVLPLSARTRPALEQLTTRLAEHLCANPDLPLADVAFTLQIGREAFAHRRTVVAGTAREAGEALAVRDPTRVFTAEARSRSVAFLFPGLGDADLGGAADLYRHVAVFRAALDACAERLLPIAGLDVRGLVLAPAAGRSLRRANIGPAELLPASAAQPAVFALSWALHALWTSIGVRPERLAGYSLGEYAAATAAGLFSVDDALTLVAARGRLLDELPAGAMTAVGLSARGVAELRMPGISIAAVNGDEMVVVAGAPADVEALERRLERDEIVFRRLATGRAFHTSHMAPAAKRLARELAAAPRAAPHTPFFSNVTGRLHDPDSAVSTRYWCDHMVQPVLFAPILEAVAGDPACALVQVGPGANLVQMARVATGGARDRVSVTSLPEEGDGLAHWLTAVGRLWASGVDIEWTALGDTAQHARVPLPTYPFERRRHWVDGPAPTVVPSRPAGSSDLAAPRGEPRRAARSGELAAPTAARAVPAGDEQEGAMLAVWRASFGFDDIGLDDDFFTLGGHSLLALQLLHRLRRLHGADLGVRDLIEHPTVSRLSARWAALAGSHRSPPLRLTIAALRAAPLERQAELAERYMADAVAAALGVAGELGRERPLGPLGLAENLADLVRVLRRDFDLVVHPHELMARPTVAGLARLLREALGLAAPEPRQAPTSPPRAATSPLPALSRRNRPIAFIFSSARSGSTLLRLMLAGHPKLFCPPELHLLMYATLRERSQGLSTRHFGSGLPRALMELCRIDAARADRMVADWLSHEMTIPDVYRELQSLAWPRLVVDKSPSYAESPGTLRRIDDWFASSYPIVLARHPYSVMESYVRNRIGSMAEPASDPWGQAERHWTTAYRNIFEFLDGAPRPCHILRYEELVAEPERTMRGVCSSLGIDYNRAVVTPYEGRRMMDGVGDPGLHEREGIDARLGEKWRGVRPPRALGDEARRLAERLGYDVRGTPR